MSEAAHGCELLVDGVCGQTAGFEVHPIANDDDAIEGQARFRTVPCYELIDSMLVNAPRARRAEAVEYRRFGMIQIW